MATIFRIMGRLTGRALSSHVIDRAITAATSYVVTEMRLADLKLKRTILRRKRTRHLTILGRTVYRLTLHDINPASDERVIRLSQVLDEIEQQIDSTEKELSLRMERLKQEKNRTSSENASPNP